MSDVERAVWIGLAAVSLYVIYTDPRCNQFCKNLIANIAQGGVRRLA